MDHDNPKRLEALDLLTRRMDRRAVLARGLALGLSAPAIAALLAACGGDDKATATKPAAAGTTPTAGSAAGGSTPTTGSARTSPTSGGASPTAGGGAATATTGGNAAPTATTASTGGAPTGKLVIGRNIDDIITFDPAQAYEFSVFPPFWAAYQAMLLPDPNELTTFLPILCEETPSAENGGISADGLKYTFKLKKGLMFSTGNEMKAADWVFCAKRLAYLKKNPSFLAAPFTSADGATVNVTAIDDYTVEYALNEPNVAFLAYMSSIPGLVYDSTFLKTVGGLDTADAETKDTAQQWLDQHSAGVGPYQLTSFKARDEVVMEPFSGSGVEQAAFEQVIFRYIADSGTQQQQLEGGDIDFAWGLDPDAINSLKSNADVQVVEQPGLVINYLAMNNDPTVGDILSDVKVRQAVAWSIDYDGIVNDLEAGAAVRPASTAAIGMLGADKVQDLAYHEDLDKAKSLLQEAGADGKEWTLSYSGNAPADEIVCTKLKADIERSGLKVKLNPMDPTQLLQDYRAAKLQAVFLQWGPDYLDVHTNTFPFAGVPDVSGPAARVKYINEDSAALLAEGIKETDPAKREEDYVKVETNIINDASFVVIFQPVSQYAGKKTLSGITIHPQWFFLFDRMAASA
jgi:peptide/nickel transport system substrate-binding protein